MLLLAILVQVRVPITALIVLGSVRLIILILVISIQDLYMTKYKYTIIVSYTHQATFEEVDTLMT